MPRSPQSPPTMGTLAMGTTPAGPNRFRNGAIPAPAARGRRCCPERLQPGPGSRPGCREDPREPDSGDRMAGALSAPVLPSRPNPSSWRGRIIMAGGGQVPHGDRIPYSDQIRGDGAAPSTRLSGEAPPGGMLPDAGPDARPARPWHRRGRSRHRGPAPAPPRALSRPSPPPSPRIAFHAGWGGQPGGRSRDAGGVRCRHPGAGPDGVSSVI